MAANDDLDELEAQLGDYDYDDDDEDDSPLKRALKKYKLIFIAAAVVIPVLIGAALWPRGDNTIVGDRKIVVVPGLAVEPGQAAKMTPDQPGGDQVPGQENRVYNMVTEGKNAGNIAITSPPEDPKNPPAAGEMPMSPEGAGEMPMVAMNPEGAEKTPKDGKSAEGTMPPPTPPTKDGVASLPILPVPTAPGDGKTAESILPVPPADGKAPEAVTPGVKTPDQPAVVAMQPVQPAVAPVLPKVTATGNQITVAIPKATGATAMVTPPSPPPGNTNVTPMRTMAGVYRVQVASARSESAAKTLWKNQVKKHPDVLGQLPLTVQSAVIQDRGAFFRVQGGAFGDREAADSVCRKLKSRGQDCLVVRP